MECFQIANFLLTKHLFFQWLMTPDQALLPYAMIPLDGTHIVLVMGLIPQKVPTKVHQRGELN